MKTRILTLIFALLSLTVSGYASNPLEEADSAYSKGDYASAISIWESVEELEGTSASLLYNMGNAYFQNGDFGQAMALWQRALRLDPTNKEIKTNIRYLTNRVEDANKAEQKGKNLKVVPDEVSFFGSINKIVTEEHSSDMWAAWGVVAFLLFIIASSLYIFSRSVMVKKAGFFAGLVCLPVCILFVIFSFAAASAAGRSDEGVVTAFKVTLQTEPGKDSQNGAVLTKGTKVRIVSEEQDAEGTVTWRKVRLNSDYIGWLKAEDVELI